MFDDKARVAAVGPQDAVFALRVLGIKTHSPRDLDEAREILGDLEENNIALCFLHHSYFENLQEERVAFEKKLVPVVIGFSDYREITDHLENMMKEMAIKATGSDALVKRRGNHGTR